LSWAPALRLKLLESAADDPKQKPEDAPMIKSTWKETAELIGILAIVASLIALVMELRQTQSALLAETYQARAIDAISEQLAVADSEYLLPVLVATNNGADSTAVARLDPEDRMRLFNFLRARMIDWDNEHYQYQSGFMDADFFAATTRKSVQEWAPRWRAMGLEEGREEFREYVDRVLSESQQDPETN